MSQLAHDTDTDTERVHLALNFRGTACGTSEDFIDMTQDRSAVTCAACTASHAVNTNLAPFTHVDI